MKNLITPASKMISNKKSNTKKKSTGFDLTPIIILLGIVSFILTIYIGYRTSLIERKLFSVSLLALFAGLIFESFRVSDSWKMVVHIFIGSYFFSLLNFLPYKRENYYNFENHLEAWPYYFIFFFALAFAIINKDRVTAKLTEGITLLQSLSLLYWAIDYGFRNYNNWLAISLLIIALLLSAFSILNALTYLQLTKRTRLILSIWSTIIMFAFAIDNIISVFSNQDIESTDYLPQVFYIGLQYFLLGVAAVYIMQNFILLSRFLPSRNGNYKTELKEIIKDHIDRFSDQQVFIRLSLFCILYAGTIYGLNYKYQVLPRHTMIWFAFVTFPIILQIGNLINRQKATASI
jgi:predicted outer membrane lipoprotein